MYPFLHSSQALWPTYLFPLSASAHVNVIALCTCLSGCAHKLLPIADMVNAEWYIVGASVSSGVSTAPFQR